MSMLPRRALETGQACSACSAAFRRFNFRGSIPSLAVADTGLAPAVCMFSAPGDPGREQRWGWRTVPLTPATFAGSRLFQLAPVYLLGLRRPYLDMFAARNLSEQRSGLAQRCLRVEDVKPGACHGYVRLVAILLDVLSFFTEIIPCVSSNPSNTPVTSASPSAYMVT